MEKINFNNKKFILLENSKNGKVDSNTIFHYKQDGNLVTADYRGGTIKYGKIIAQLDGRVLNMLYQCMTVENEMKAGKAIGRIAIDGSNKIKIQLEWQWLTDDKTTGYSEYIEL